MAFINQDAVSMDVSSFMASLAMQRPSPTLSPTTLKERGSTTIKLANKTTDKHASLLLMKKRHLAEEILSYPDENDCQQQSKRLRMTTLKRQAAVGCNFEQRTNEWQLTKQKGVSSEVVATTSAPSGLSSYAKLLGKRRNQMSLLDAHEQANNDTLARGISLLEHAFRASSL